MEESEMETMRAIIEDLQRANSELTLATEDKVLDLVLKLLQKRNIEGQYNEKLIRAMINLEDFSDLASNEEKLLDHLQSIRNYIKHNKRYKQLGKNLKNEFSITTKAVGVNLKFSSESNSSSNQRKLPEGNVMILATIIIFTISIALIALFRKRS